MQDDHQRLFYPTPDGEMIRKSKEIFEIAVTKIIENGYLAYLGIKCRSVLNDIVYLDIGRSVNVEIMHLIPLGIVKRLLALGSSFKNRNTLGHITLKSELNDRLSVFKLNSHFKRQGVLNLNNLRDWKNIFFTYRRFVSKI